MSFNRVKERLVSITGLLFHFGYNKYFNLKNYFIVFCILFTLDLIFTIDFYNFYIKFYISNKIIICDLFKNIKPCLQPYVSLDNCAFSTTSSLYYYINNVAYFSLNKFQYTPSFINNFSYILVYLSIWQYWWWFWFIFLTFFYYILLFRILVFRQFKFYPKLNSSVKSHGKWGDFLIGAIPVYWCFNILLNSNTLLKIFEWQYESSFLTVRIRGKQWYWVYKIDFINLNNLYFLNKNVGNNFIVKKNASKNINNVFLSYLNVNWAHRYYKKYLPSIMDGSNNYTSILYFLNTLCLVKKHFLYTKCVGFLTTDIFTARFQHANANFKINNALFYFLNPIAKLQYSKYIKINYTFNLIIQNFVLRVFKPEFDYNYYNKLRAASKPGLLLVYDINLSTFKICWPNQVLKNSINSFFLSLKQKKIEFNKRGKFIFFNNFSRNNNFLLNFTKFNATNITSASNRLLSTNFTLVLPSDIIICIITNSFDVIHSWFVPGIGIKMDCVPGRSTHHSFFFDTCGLFYGQCAEVCGRFHHHMPIKVFITHYESFLVWVTHILIKFVYLKKKY